MRSKLGYCRQCCDHHSVPVTGAVTRLGLALAASSGIAAKKLGIALAVSLASLLFGDVIETWIRARCPACGVALQIARTIVA